CAPRPPAEVTLGLHENGVEISWSESVSAGEISYVLVRKTGGAPSSVDDGEVLARTRLCSWLDTGTVPGGTYGYAVMAVRSEATSPLVTPLAPIFVAREVSACEVVAGDREVRVTWQVPPGAQRVVVHREIFALEAGGQPCEIAVRERDGFVDLGVVNGTSYRYRIQVEYRDLVGLRRTTGRVVVARPEDPPCPVRTVGEPTWSAGTYVSPRELSILSHRLPLDGVHAAVDREPVSGLVFYVPITVLGQCAVVGRALRFANLEDVRDVEVEDFGGYLQLRWCWPRGCSTVRVAWRSDAHPASGEDAQASTVDLSRGEYENRGGFRIQQPADRPYWFTVFAAAIAGPDLVFSPGASASCRAACRHQTPARVRYHFRRRPMSREVLLVLEADANVRCPELVVVARPGAMQPINRSDGRVVARLADLDLGSGAREVRIDMGDLPQPTYLRAFFGSDSDYRAFTLIDPPVKELRYA
ncbi:MAG: hypothetical protein EB084_16525, partial [Proteobacteria bacterium]|nr:hypothetical protein [Pseudomonadota bacterium]